MGPQGDPLQQNGQPPPGMYHPSLEIHPELWQQLQEQQQRQQDPNRPVMTPSTFRSRIDDSAYLTRDVSWVLQELPPTPDNQLQARLIAESYETMRLWTAVCWEYSVTLYQTMRFVKIAREEEAARVQAESEGAGKAAEDEALKAAEEAARSKAEEEARKAAQDEAAKLREEEEALKAAEEEAARLQTEQHLLEAIQGHTTALDSMQMLLKGVQDGVEAVQLRCQALSAQTAGASADGLSPEEELASLQQEHARLSEQLSSTSAGLATIRQELQQLEGKAAEAGPTAKKAWSVAMEAAGAVEESSQQAQARLEASATTLQSLASQLQDQQQVQHALEQLQQQEVACRQATEAVEQQAQAPVAQFTVWQQEHVATGSKDLSSEQLGERAATLQSDEQALSQSIEACSQQLAQLQQALAEAAGLAAAAPQAVVPPSEEDVGEGHAGNDAACPWHNASEAQRECLRGLESSAAQQQARLSQLRGDLSDFKDLSKMLEEAKQAAEEQAAKAAEEVAARRKSEEEEALRAVEDAAKQAAAKVEAEQLLLHDIQSQLASVQAEQQQLQGVQEGIAALETRCQALSAAGASSDGLLREEELVLLQQEHARLSEQLSSVSASLAAKCQDLQQLQGKAAEAGPTAQEAWSMAMAAAGAVEESSQQARARLEASATALRSLACQLQSQQQVQQALEQLQQQGAACRQSVEAVEQQAQAPIAQFTAWQQEHVATGSKDLSPEQLGERAATLQSDEEALSQSIEACSQQLAQLQQALDDAVRLAVAEQSASVSSGDDAPAAAGHRPCPWHKASASQREQLGALQIAAASVKARLAQLCAYLQDMSELARSLNGSLVEEADGLMAEEEALKAAAGVAAASKAEEEAGSGEAGAGEASVLDSAAAGQAPDGETGHAGSGEAEQADTDLDASQATVVDKGSNEQAAEPGTAQEVVGAELADVGAAAETMATASAGESAEQSSAMPAAEVNASAAAATDEEARKHVEEQAAAAAALMEEEARKNTEEEAREAAGESRKRAEEAAAATEAADEGAQRRADGDAAAAAEEEARRKADEDAAAALAAAQEEARRKADEDAAAAAAAAEEEAQRRADDDATAAATAAEEEAKHRAEEEAAAAAAAAAAAKSQAEHQLMLDIQAYASGVQEQEAPLQAVEAALSVVEGQVHGLQVQAAQQPQQALQHLLKAEEQELKQQQQLVQEVEEQQQQTSGHAVGGVGGSADGGAATTTAIQGDQLQASTQEQASDATPAAPPADQLKTGEEAAEAAATEQGEQQPSQADGKTGSSVVVAGIDEPEDQAEAGQDQGDRQDQVPIQTAADGASLPDAGDASTLNGDAVLAGTEAEAGGKLGDAEQPLERLSSADQLPEGLTSADQLPEGLSSADPLPEGLSSADQPQEGLNGAAQPQAAPSSAHQQQEGMGDAHQLQDRMSDAEQPQQGLSIESQVAALKPEQTSIEGQLAAVSQALAGLQQARQQLEGAIASGTPEVQEAWALASVQEAWSAATAAAASAQERAQHLQARLKATDVALEAIVTQVHDQRQVQQALEQLQQHEVACRQSTEAVEQQAQAPIAQYTTWQQEHIATGSKDLSQELLGERAATLQSDEQALSQSIEACSQQLAQLQQELAEAAELSATAPQAVVPPSDGDVGVGHAGNDAACPWRNASEAQRECLRGLESSAAQQQARLSQLRTDLSAFKDLSKVLEGAKQAAEEQAEKAAEEEAARRKAEEEKALRAAEEAAKQEAAKVEAEQLLLQEVQSRVESVQAEQQQLQGVLEGIAALETRCQALSAAGAGTDGLLRDEELVSLQQEHARLSEQLNSTSAGLAAKCQDLQQLEGKAAEAGPAALEAWSVAMAAAAAVEESSQQARARLEASATALQSLASMLQDQQQVQQALEQLQQQEAACRQSVEAVEQQAQALIAQYTAWQEEHVATGSKDLSAEQLHERAATLQSDEQALSQSIEACSQQLAQLQQALENAIAAAGSGGAEPWQQASEAQRTQLQALRDGTATLHGRLSQLSSKASTLLQLSEALKEVQRQAEEEALIRAEEEARRVAEEHAARLRAEEEAQAKALAEQRMLNDLQAIKASVQGCVAQLQAVEGGIAALEARMQTYTQPSRVRTTSRAGSRDGAREGAEAIVDKAARLAALQQEHAQLEQQLGQAMQALASLQQALLQAEAAAVDVGANVQEENASVYAARDAAAERADQLMAALQAAGASLQAHTAQLSERQRLQQALEGLTQEASGCQEALEAVELQLQAALSECKAWQQEHSGGADKALSQQQLRERVDALQSDEHGVAHGAEACTLTLTKLQLRVVSIANLLSVDAAALSVPHNGADESGGDGDAAANGADEAEPPAADDGLQWQQASDEQRQAVKRLQAAVASFLGRAAKVSSSLRPLPRLAGVLTAQADAIDGLAELLTELIGETLPLLEAAAGNLQGEVQRAQQTSAGAGAAAAGLSRSMPSSPAAASPFGGRSASPSRLLHPRQQQAQRLLQEVGQVVTAIQEDLQGCRSQAEKLQASLPSADGGSVADLEAAEQMMRDAHQIASTLQWAQQVLASSRTPLTAGGALGSTRQQGAGHSPMKGRQRNPYASWSYDYIPPNSRYKKPPPPLSHVEDPNLDAQLLRLLKEWKESRPSATPGLGDSPEYGWGNALHRLQVLVDSEAAVARQHTSPRGGGGGNAVVSGAGGERAHRSAAGTGLHLPRLNAAGAPGSSEVSPRGPRTAWGTPTGDRARQPPLGQGPRGPSEGGSEEGEAAMPGHEWEGEEGLSDVDSVDTDILTGEAAGRPLQPGYHLQQLRMSHVRARRQTASPLPIAPGPHPMLGSPVRGRQRFQNIPTSRSVGGWQTAPPMGGQAGGAGRASRGGSAAVGVGQLVDPPPSAVEMRKANKKLAAALAASADTPA